MRENFLMELWPNNFFTHTCVDALNIHGEPDPEWCTSKQWAAPLWYFVEGTTSLISCLNI